MNCPGSAFILIPIVLFGLVSCTPGDSPPPDQITPTSTIGKAYGNVDELNQDAYRIDITQLELTLDYHPREFYFDGSAEIKFLMLRDQSRPIIHLDPVVNDTSLLLALELDGESLDVPGDWQIIDGLHSNQKAMEILRELSSSREHSLKIRYRKRLSRSYYMLNSQVSDLYGIGNELYYPTINRFGDPLHHIITIRVHGDISFRCLGSGRVTPLQTEGIQSWQLDSLREVPSNTVMFVLVPSEDSDEDTRILSDVRVRLVSFKGGASIEEGFHILEPWLQELISHFGPFPMPEGFSVFLLPGGGGMEYYGGTISSLWALGHETFHMYFGTSLLLSTYRDSWIDEAVNEWYELSAFGGVGAIDDDFVSNMVSGRSPVGLGFDRRAYNEGAQIMEHIAQSLGGRTEMIHFLAQLYQNHVYMPFNTQEFLTFLEQYSGLDYRQRFASWLYSGETVQAGNGTDLYVTEKHKIDLTPPYSIIEKYPELNRECPK